MSTTENGRKADHPIEQLFLDRWSPRAFTEEAIPEAALQSMFEAARWAPSSYNSQPWVFLYAIRGSEHWDKYLGLLNEFNQSWAKRAGALVILVSNSVMVPPGSDRPVPSHSHSLDTGAAWAQFALQGAKLGWFAHAMVGFDLERAFKELEVAPGFRVECAIAVGKHGDKNILPDMLKAREAPNERKSVDEFAFRGAFPDKLKKG